ncbi:nitrilase-related carbon-nitrogen hydrolase [Allorhizocola rhizosphaerae]|uniref:nitrilase-related carbon-nitrogen hydrolase n=1 Tax=Allorhizocola rhizosphaerae TaxID=1872709 RepID=UPI000E3C31A3|nr:nitrilase-related carbon-nitrogen hydrolase [Allorhizocola rhizosphaerae]
MMSWLWLTLGGAILPFTLLQTTIPLAAWLAPLLLLRFSRTVKARWAVPALALVGALSTYASFRDVVSTDQMLVAAVGGAVLTPIPYAIDRLLAGRLTGIARTLVFPMADTALVFLFSTGDFGSTGHVAGTQVGNLPLLQSAAVGGQWIIAFLIAWAAAVANEVWQRRTTVGAGRTLLVFGAVLGAVLALGGARVALDPPNAPTVRITGLAPNRASSDALMSAKLAPGPRSAAERAEVRERYFMPLLDDLVSRTERAARAGAPIVVWAEASAYEFVEDKDAVVERARSVARTEGIYLQIGTVWLLPVQQAPFVEIRAIMFDPTGAIVWDYLKATEALSDGNVRGPGIMPTVDTPYGRLATVICFDASFPALVRQAGRAGVDILLVPSSDWAPVTDALNQQATLRAVENGVSMVRPVRQGTSLAVDHQGRVLGQDASWYRTDPVTTEHTLTVAVPIRGVKTPYALFFGDVLGWLSIAGLLAAAAVVVLRRRVARTATPDGPADDDEPKRQHAGVLTAT